MDSLNSLYSNTNPPEDINNELIDDLGCTLNLTQKEIRELKEEFLKPNY